MREISIGGKPVPIRATPPALLYYRQQFGSDLVKDMLQMFPDDPKALSGGALHELHMNPQDFNASTVLQMAWAMARADARSRRMDVPSFDGWLAEFEFVDFADPTLAVGVFEEAQDGFFRGARPSPGGANLEQRGAGGSD